MRAFVLYAVCAILMGAGAALVGAWMAGAPGHTVAEAAIGVIAFVVGATISFLGRRIMRGF